MNIRNDLLANLQWVPCNITPRTFGDAHCTLVGNMLEAQMTAAELRRVELDVEISQNNGTDCLAGDACLPSTAQSSRQWVRPANSVREAEPCPRTAASNC